jgi:NAD-dependent dihydropyrimidine dehydrogenase PreA subunit
MAHAIGAACIDLMDRTCVEVCPVDCIYEGGRKLYINPIECIDCGACIPTCPVEAIHVLEDFPADDRQFAEDNATFFEAILPEHDAPLGNPGGTSFVGTIGVDTELVLGHRAS